MGVLIPALLVGGGIYFVTKNKKKKKGNGKSKKSLDFSKAYDWFKVKINERKKVHDAALWRPLRLEAPLSFIGGNATVGHQIVMRVGTKDRTDPNSESNNLLYPISASDKLGYNYYRVIEILENKYDLDKLGRPKQKQVVLERVYSDLPGPLVISFFKGKSSTDFQNGYGCSECWYTDAALLEYDGAGRFVSGAKTPTASSDFAKILENRYPRPTVMTRTQKLRRFYNNLSGDKRGAVASVLGEERMRNLLKIIEDGDEVGLDSFVVRASDSFSSMSDYEQAKLIYRAQSALGRDNISELIDILS